MAWARRHSPNKHFQLRLQLEYTKNDKGWMIDFISPIFGFSFRKHFLSFTRWGFTTSIWFGLIFRAVHGDGDEMFIWNFRKEYSFEPGDSPEDLDAGI